MISNVDESPNEHKSETLTSLFVSTSQKGGTLDNLSVLKLISIETSKIDPSSKQGFRERFNSILGKKIDWPYLRGTAKKWLRNPLNMVLLLWITCVAVSGAILFLVMTGMLNAVLPEKSQRNEWFEFNNQILNALFTLMCLYQHPKRFHHLVLLLRWTPHDVSRLRKIYCKNGARKPREWTHIAIVIALLHLNCFAQYALCGVNLGYKRSNRPPVAVGLCLSVSIGAPAIAAIYSIFSPLGREYESETDEEAFGTRNDDRKTVENKPDWRGGLFDFREDISVFSLSIFCSFCVFGRNMERLGLGNKYVHIVTFSLFCIAPFWVFYLAAANMDSESVRIALRVTGFVLCVLGLLYGGFWRIRMRKRYNLPGNGSCFGEPGVLDCAKWLFCCWCSLAQEVRTADFYDVMGGKSCRKIEDQSGDLQFSTLAREDGMNPPIPSSFHRM